MASSKYEAFKATDLKARPPTGAVAAHAVLRPQRRGEADAAERAYVMPVSARYAGALWLCRCLRTARALHRSCRKLERIASTLLAELIRVLNNEGRLSLGVLALFVQLLVSMKRTSMLIYALDGWQNFYVLVSLCNALQKTLRAISTA
eukprot:290016-Pleurochrysis_carterae.AAC.4